MTLPQRNTAPAKTREFGKPHTLLIDIETMPNKGYVWGKWQQDVIEFIRHWYILSFAWQWYGESKRISVMALDDLPHYKPGMDDEKLMPVLWQLLDRADIVIAHNGKAFDSARIRTRFLQHGYGPPSPYKIIDTLKVDRKFGFNSNKLDDVGRDTGIGRKKKHFGFHTWKGCEDGDPSAWKMMKAYNKKDIDLLRKHYEQLLPWIENHPNMGIETGQADACPNCGSNRVQQRGIARNKTTAYQRYHCQSCGAWSRGSKNIIPNTSKPLVGIAVSG